MRRWMLVTLLAVCSVAGDVVGQQSTPPDTAKAPAQPAVNTDSTKETAHSTDDGAHRRKVLWWVGGIAVFILLNLLISDRPSKSE